MRYLGIDYGTKRIGVAWSDPSGRMAFPHSVIANTAGAHEEFVTLIKKEAIGGLVAGDSRDLQGRENKFMPEARTFCVAISEATGLPLEWIPEQFTTVQATRIQGSNNMKDASAAAIILQTYLDRINPPMDDADDWDED